METLPLFPVDHLFVIPPVVEPDPEPVVDLLTVIPGQLSLFDEEES